MIYLGINTTNDLIELKLFECEGLIDQGEWTSGRNQTEELLSLVEKILQKNKIQKEELSGILVCMGPGSYTGIRVSVTTANFLAFGLNKPVFGYLVGKEREALVQIQSAKNFESPVLPFYENEPFITKTKARL